MNSNNGLKNSLVSILDGLESIKTKNRSELLRDCVEQRLNQSLMSYYHDIRLAFEKINSIHDDIRLMRRLNKL